MSEKQAAAASDPLAMWRDWLSQSERQWNQFLNEAMATDQFSQAMGRSMDVFLNSQKSLSEGMGRYFSALNMPTRTDVLSLGNRLEDIEQRLASIEEALAIALRGSASPAPGSTSVPAKKPARTKKPAPRA
jgi:polyhydroxyalkanoic acid synthase PhaR subunit